MTYTCCCPYGCSCFVPSTARRSTSAAQHFISVSPYLLTFMTHVHAVAMLAWCDAGARASFIWICVLFDPSVRLASALSAMRLMGELEGGCVSMSSISRH
jgi:hypothetical protein